MAARKAEVIYVGDAASLVRASKEAGAAVGRTHGEVEKFAAKTEKSFARVKNAAKGLAAIGGISALAFGLKDITDEAVKAEAEQKKLANTVKDAGLSWHAHSKQIEEWLDKTSRASGFAKSDLTASFGNMVRTTGSLTKAQHLNGLAMDVARSKGIGLAGAQSLIARTYNGSFVGLKRLGIAITPVTKNQDALKASTKHATDEQKRHAKELDKTATRTQALGLVQQKFGGQSKAYAQSTAGAFARAKASLQLVEERVGKIVLPLMASAATAIAGLADSADKHWPEIKAQANKVFIPLKSILLGVVTVTKHVIEWFGKHQTVAVTLAGALGGLAAAIVVVKAVTLGANIAAKAYAISMAVLNAVMELNPMVALATAAAIVVGALVALELKTHFVEKAWRALKSAFKAVTSWIGGAASAAFGEVKKAASVGLLGPVPLIIFHWKTVVSFFKSLPGRIVNFFYHLPNKLLEVGSNAVSALANGIKNGAGAVYEAFKSIAKKGVNLLTHPWKIFSPSRVFMDIGKYVTQGLAIGIRNGGSEVEAAVNAGMLFPMDAAIAGLESRKTRLQKVWDAIDARASRSELVRAIGTAQNQAVSSASSGAVDSGLGWARSMIGHFKESTGKNTGPELDALQRSFGTHAAAWCAEFATTALIKAGAPKEIKSASVAQLRAWASAGAHGFQKGIRKSGQAGDLMAFGSHHVGVVESVDRKRGIVHTIEGNTSSGKVSRETHAIGAGDYLRPVYKGLKASAVKSSGKLSVNQIRGLSYASGFRGHDLDVAVAIAEAESGGRVKATNKNSNGSIDRGLFQINSVHGKQSTFNPTKNAKNAYKIFKAAGGSFKDWTTFNSGAYKKFLGNTGSGKGSMAAIMSGAASGKSGGSAGSVKDAIKALHDFDKAAARTKKLARIDLKIANLQKLKAFKDAVDNIRSSLHDLAGQAASVWRAQQDAAIDSSDTAKELARLQADDAAKADAKTQAGLAKDLADAIAAGDTQAISDAQDAIAAYKQGKREDELQANLDAAHQKAADDEDTYRAGLDAQLQILTDNLEQRKQSYADWAKAVNDILSGYGLSVATSAGDEAAITAANPGSHGATGGSFKIVKGKAIFYDSNGKAVGSGFLPQQGWVYDVDSAGHATGLHPRRDGGPVFAGQSYLVGETGKERFTPAVNGRIDSASRTARGGGGGPTVIVENMNVRSSREVVLAADRLAFRLKYG